VPTLRRFRIAILTPLLFLAQAFACDPMGPTAVGVVRLSPEASAEGGLTLEVRAFAEEIMPWVGPEESLAGHEWLLESSRPLEGMTFPLEYEVGGQLGTSEHEEWRVLVWIARSEAREVPQSGEWFGTVTFSLDDCGILFSSYCGVAMDLEVEIDQQLP